MAEFNKKNNISLHALMTSRFQQASLNVPDPTSHNEPDNTCIATGHLYDGQSLVHCPSGKKKQWSNSFEMEKEIEEYQTQVFRLFITYFDYFFPSRNILTFLLSLCV